MPGQEFLGRLVADDARRIPLGRSPGDREAIGQQAEAEGCGEHQGSRKSRHRVLHLAGPDPGRSAPSVGALGDSMFRDVGRSRRMP